MTSSQQYDVQFEHNDTRLSGTVFAPASPGPHPALVMIQGSGATDRTNFGYFPAIHKYFVQHGIAVLCYDKPGVGASSGNWKHQHASDRATEALAARRVLQAQPHVDAASVGLWGISQGGWVVPLAASLAPDVAFTIPVSGPGVSPAEQDRYGIEHLSRIKGFGEQHIAQAVALYDALVDAARRDLSFAEVMTLIEHGRNDAWDNYYGSLDEALWNFLKRGIDYDPVPVLERVTQPLLAIFGERDPLVPVQRSVTIFERALAKAGNSDVTIRVFPDADHGIEIGDSGDFAPDYLETMVDWIWQRVRTKKP